MEGQFGFRQVAAPRHSCTVAEDYSISRALLFASVLLIFCQVMYFMTPMKVHWSMLAHYAECGKLHGLQGSYTGEEGLLASQGCVWPKLHSSSLF